MPLTKLENLISSKTGRYLYVSPDDFNASDALDNRGNSPTRPFLTIQRAFLEVGRYSYVPGQENDRFDQFTIMLSPGNHYIDNRPGIANPEEIAPFAYNQATQEWEDESIVDLGNPNNILYKFNGPTGGATIPRGTSLVGMDLRRTRLHPLYVPDPADSDIGRTTMFNVTGGCYFWQFTILDGDVERNSPLFNTQENIGKVYYQPGNTLTTIPYYSHHKICNFEFASKDDLGLLYRKIARAFSLFQPTIDDPGEFEQRPQENRIVGPLQDAIRIDSIEVNDVAGTSALDVTVKTKTNHGYYVGQAVAVASLRSTLPAGASEPIPLSNDPLTGVFSVREISITDPKEFSYRVIGKNAAAVGLGDKIGTSITPPDLDTNASTQAEIDSVESASPYVFNVSIRSTWGICGIHADGSKASGFKSMVIAQYTGVSLQRDDRAFIRYDEFSNTWNQAPLTDAFATTPYHTKGDAYWKDDWRNFHVKASNDAFIQNVSIFAVGFADHFLMESGGDMSITNSNSNFGNTSLHAIGYKGYAFSQDQGGYISHIVPPKKVTTTTKKYQYFTFNQIKVRGSSSLDTSGPVNIVRLYLGTDEASDPLSKPATTVNGYRLGGQSHEKIYVKLDPATGFTGSIREAEVSPAGYRKYDVALSILSPTSNNAVISDKDQDAANSIDLNRDFIASETYGYITRKYPYLLTREGITIGKCRRDVGYVLEAVANDLRVGGNVNSVQAGQSYYTGNNLDFIEGEKEESLDAFNYARGLAIAAMRNWEFRIENCVTILNNSTVTVPAAYTTIGLVEGMTVVATPATGQTNPIPSGTYVKEVISTTQFVLGNSNDTDTVNATATITAQGLSGGVTLNFELNQAKFASSSGRGLDAGNLITANKDFIAEEALILAKQWDPATNVPDDTKCKRDIKLILDGVIQDLATFGNAGIVDAATSYVGAADRFFDAKNLILSNRKEIIDKAAAKLAIEYPDFYYGGSGFSDGGDAQTNVYGRYKDAYRLIQQNKKHIEDKAVAAVAIAHPDFYFPGDAQNDAGALFADGYRLIQQNKTEIVQSAYDEIVIQHPGFVNPNPASCIRDLGIFIDSVSLDLFQGGNRYTRLFTLEYFNGPGAGTLIGEEAQTITAYNKASELMKAAITNQLTVKDLTIGADPVTEDNQSPQSCSTVRTNIDNLNSILITALTVGNINSLPNESAGSIITDGESKCKRDVGMFIDAISTDLTTLGNSYSIDFAKQYFVEGNVNGEVLTFTPAAGTTLLNRADRIYNGVETTTNGSGVGVTFRVTRDSSGVVDSVTILNGGYGYVASDIITIPGGSIGGVDIADNLVVTVDTVEQAWIAAGLQGEEGPSITAFTSAIETMKLAFNNQLFVKDLTLTGDPQPGNAGSGISVFGTPGVTTNNQDSQSCSNIQATVNTLSEIIFGRIRQGDMVTGTTPNPAVPEINYGSSPSFQEKCKRDIGIVVDAIAEDLGLGGNYNVINATLSYFDSTGNTLISNGLAGELVQSITAFAEARDFCFKAVTNQLNIRDFDISTGPGELGVAGPDIPNDNKNACLDVRNNIDTLFGILIDKLNNSALALPATTYNAGAYSLAGELNISVYAYKKARDLAILAMRNWRTGDGLATDPLYVKDGSNTLDYNVDLTIDTSTAGVPVCADVAYTIATEFDILIDALESTGPLPPRNSGSDEYIVRYSPQKDDSITLDSGADKCAGTKDAIIEKMRVVDSIIRNGVDAEPLVSQLVNTSDFATRATLFRVGGANPHNMETGTPVRLVPKAANDTVDKRLIRLPKGFDTNTKYYVIAPGKITQPNDYSSGGATAQFNDSQTFMLATSPENATAGNYIYSSETATISKDIEIEVHQYLTDVNYDLHRYTCELISSRVFETTTNHVFDTAINGVQIQQVFFYPLETNLINGEAVGAALDTLPTKSTGSRLEIDRPYYVGRPATYTKNNEFSLYLTVQNAIDKQNAVQFNFPSGQSFHVFATKKRSPLGYDAAQQSWYIKSLQSGNEIYERITMADASRGSLYVNKPPRTPDSFFYRADDSRKKEDKSYKLRYVIPNYRDDVRDPLEGFAIRLRTDEKRKLLPQKLLLKPVAAGVQKDATFFEEGPSPRERLGVSAALTEYDPYNPIFAKRIEGTKTESNISFTIQSAKTNADGYLEMTVFDHGLDLESLKAERFVSVKVGQPQGGNGDFVEGSTVTWYGDYTGSATVHSWFGTENVEGGLEAFNYLILKGVNGSLDFADSKQTFIRQTIAGQADVTAEVLDRPNFGKEDKKDFLYGVEASNVYCITPGDVITDDAARQYRVVSVEDTSDLTETYYVYSIEEIQRRIPRQQDGVYYLTVVRGDIRPLPLGSGVGTNFRKFKFSQPVSRLYPLTYKNDPLLFQYDGSDEQGGNQDATLLDPPAASCAADNYIHGLVTINDAKNSATKEAILDLISNPGSGDYSYTGSNEIKAQTGAASSGAEERLIPIAGDSGFPLEQKLFIELRRPSIARAGNHTFEYLGFGPGNYSTGFPVRQTVILTDIQDYYAQAKKQDGGIVFYTGINSNGELYIGNRKINAITGEEEFLDALILEEEDGEDGDFGSLVTVFEDPVTFENIITLNAPPDLRNFFNSPVTINVDPEFEAKMTPPSLTIVSRPGDRQGVLPGDDDPQLDTTRAGDIIIDKNRVRAAIFDLNPRGTQRYTLRSGITNLTPNQDTTGTKARFNSSQTFSFGSTVPLSGDILFKGGEVGNTGSLGWVYANSYVPYTLSASAGNESSIDITGVEFYPNLNVVRLIFQVGKVNFSSSNPGASLGITLSSQIKITGGQDRLATLNGVHTVYNNAAEGYEYLESNGYVYLITERASEAVLVGNPPYISTTNPSQQGTLEISLGQSSWKETGVIGAETLRTETSVYGDYRLGINTVARAVSSDYIDGFASSDTYPRANLDVVGTTYISGRTQTTLSDGTGGTPQASNYALLVGGDSANEDSTAEFRVATTTLSQAGRTEGATADTDNGRVGINVNDAALDKNFVVSGDARITGDFTFESDIDVDGGDIRSTSTNFVIANQSTTTGLTVAGYAQNIQIGNLATGFQNIDIGTASISATTLDIHTSSTDSIINLGTVANNNTGHKSRITVGGAFANNQDSFFNIKNFQTIVDGVLTLNGGEINTTSPTGEFKMFESGLTKLSIGLSVGTLEIGGVAGTSKIRNGLHVLGSSLFESDMTQNGGLKNTNLGIDRNVFGLIKVASVSRTSNVATVTTIDTHQLTTGNNVEIETSFNSFNPTGTVSVTVTGTNTFTYSNAGGDVASTSTTGTVIRDNVGENQAVGSLANLNIDYFSVVKNLDGLLDITTVSSSKLIVSSAPYSANDAIVFFDTGNLTGISTNTTYYIDDRDSAGFTLKDASDNPIIVGLVTGATDAGSARMQLQSTRIDTSGDIPWGDDTFKTGNLTTDGQEIYELPINNPSGVSINQLLLIDAEIVKTVDYPTSLVPDSPVPYSVQVIRGQRGTASAAHEDDSRIFRLVEQQNASYIFPSPLTATDQVVNVAEFSANIKVDDLFRLNKTDLDTGGEYVRISVINPADAQTFTINNGDFGVAGVEKDALEVFKVISTTGQTQVTGDVVIGYDTAKPFVNAANDQNFADETGLQSSTATGSTIQTTGGGNLTVHNSIELSGNTDTSNPAKQYFVITNGTLPKFYVESASGDTKLYNGADFKIFKDSFFATGNFDKSRTDTATNIALEVLGASGNTKVAGTLRAGNDFTVGTLTNSANAEDATNIFTTRFSVDAQLGSTVVGRALISANTGATLTVHGTYTNSPSVADNYFSVNNLGQNNAKPFRIRGDASIEAFSHENFYNANGGRKTIFVSTQGNNDSSAIELESNLQYLVRPSSTLVLRLPSGALTGDTVRVVDVGGALNFNVNLVVRAPLGTKLQGGATGSSLGGASNYGGGELVVNTPNAAFGLIYVGDTDADGNGIAGEQQGWFLMEI